MRGELHHERRTAHTPALHALQMSPKQANIYTRGWQRDARFRYAAGGSVRPITARKKCAGPTGSPSSTTSIRITRSDTARADLQAVQARDVEVRESATFRQTGEGVQMPAIEISPGASASTAACYTRHSSI